MVLSLNFPRKFSPVVYQAPIGNKEGEDLPRAQASKSDQGESLSSPSLMSTRVIPGSILDAPAGTLKPLAITLSKIVKNYPGLKELRLAYDPVTIETGAQKIGVIDHSKPGNPTVNLSPTEGMNSNRFKAGEIYSSFSEAHGVKTFIEDFVDQNMTNADRKQEQFVSYLEDVQSKSVNPFTNDYNFVFSNPEPGVLEIEIRNA